MDEKLFKKVLRQSLEGTVPPCSSAWRTIQTRLPKDYERKLKASRPTKSHFRWLWRLGLAAAASIAVLMLAVILLNTPQGRILAQNVLQSVPVQKLFGAQVKPTPTLPDEPTATATTQSSLAFYGKCGDIVTPICSLDQIRFLVGFPVKAPVSLPEGLTFIGATGGPDNAILVYGSADSSRSLLFYEGPSAGKVAQDIQLAAGATVETVRVGGVTGEYLQGAWQGIAPAQTLRWIDGNILIELIMLGDPKLSSTRLDMAGLLDLADHLSYGQQAVQIKPTPTPQIIDLSSVQELAGFKVRAPDILPQNVSFDHVAYNAANQTVTLFFNAGAAKLTIDESASGLLPALTDIFPPLSVLFPNSHYQQDRIMYTQKVLVGGALDGKGMYAFGASDYSTNAYTQVLQVQMSGLNFSIYAAGQDSFQGHLITQLDMIKLAEGITGVHVVTLDQLDPERLTSAKDAEEFAGFPILLPAVLPPGASPPTFAVTHADQATIVRIFFDCARNFGVMETSGSAYTLDSLSAQWKESGIGFDRITVNGQPGLWQGGYFNNGVWQSGPGHSTFELIWFADNIEYEMSGFFDMSYSKDMLEAVAESMQSSTQANLTGAQTQAGFQIRNPAPSSLPAGVTFDYANYVPYTQIVTLFFHQSRGGKLAIDESVAVPQPALTDIFPDYPPDGSISGRVMMTQEVIVGGAKGTKGIYAYGYSSYFASTNWGGSYGDTQVLQVQMDGLQFTIYATGEDTVTGGHLVTQLEMVRMAEGITGVHLVTENTLDPERLTSAQDAETFAGFPIKLPAVLPPDAKPPTFSVIQENQSRIVRIFYDCNNWVTLTETSGSTDTIDSLEAQIKKGKAGFDPITVHGQPGIWTGGFYSSGVWQFYPGDGTINTIWFEDGIKYELYAFYNINYTKEQFVAIANSMQPWQTASLAGAQSQAGFTVRQPANLPDGVTFDYASYSPYNQTVTLIFKQPRGGKLTIDESASTPQPALTDIFPDYPKDGDKGGRIMTSEEVTVGGADGGKGIYAYGASPYNVPTNWNSYAETQVLEVQMDGLQFTIYAAGQDAATGNHSITELEMIKMAEDITGVHTIAAGQLDPERLSTVQRAEVFAGFHIKVPTQLPPDAKPPLFVVSHVQGITSVKIFYDSMTLVETQGGSLPLADLENLWRLRLGFEQVSVNGQPALWSAYIRNSDGSLQVNGDAAFNKDLLWFADGIQYELGSGIIDSYTQDLFLSIANSMQ